MKCFLIIYLFIVFLAHGNYATANASTDNSKFSFCDPAGCKIVINKENKITHLIDSDGEYHDPVTGEYLDTKKSDWRNWNNWFGPFPFCYFQPVGCLFSDIKDKYFQNLNLVNELSNDPEKIEQILLALKRQNLKNIFDPEWSGWLGPRPLCYFNSISGCSRGDMKTAYDKGLIVAKNVLEKAKMLHIARKSYCYIGTANKYSVDKIHNQPSKHDRIMSHPGSKSLLTNIKLCFTLDRIKNFTLYIDGYKLKLSSRNGWNNDVHTSLPYYIPFMDALIGSSYIRTVLFDYHNHKYKNLVDKIYSIDTSNEYSWEPLNNMVISFKMYKDISNGLFKNHLSLDYYQGILYDLKLVENREEFEKDAGFERFIDDQNIQKNIEKENNEISKDSSVYFAFFQTGSDQGRIGLFEVLSYDDDNILIRYPRFKYTDGSVRYIDADSNTNGICRNLGMGTAPWFAVDAEDEELDDVNKCTKFLKFIDYPEVLARDARRKDGYAIRKISICEPIKLMRCKRPKKFLSVPVSKNQYQQLLSGKIY